jgi:hypothetical protein
MLFSPVRLDATMVGHTLHNHGRVIEHAKRAGIKVDLVYLNDCEPKASVVFNNIVSGDQDTYGDCTLLNMEGAPKSTYQNHTWNETAIDRIVNIRNMAIQHFLNSNCTHLFMVDADLLMHPETLIRLVDDAVPVVSNIFWTKWTEDCLVLPNVWDVHPYGFNSKESLVKLREPGIYPVKGLGACTLIHRSVLEKGIDYSKIPSWNMWGEDRHFCLKCETHGIPMYVDTRFPAFHVYKPELQAEAYKWVLCGYNPDYFQTHWLNNEWEKFVLDPAVTHKVTGTGEATSPAPTEKKATVAVCLPGERFSSTWVVNWTMLFGNLIKSNVEVIPIFGYSSNVYATRGSLWHELKKLPVKPDFILWIDDDNVVNTDQLQILLNDLTSNPKLDMVAGWTWCQADEHGLEPKISAGHASGISEMGTYKSYPLTYMDLKWNTVDTDLVPVDYTGFPVTLMRGELLDQMGSRPFQAILASVDDGYGMCGEDFSFCVRATRSVGVKIAVDRRVYVPHFKQQESVPDGFAKGGKPHEFKLPPNPIQQTFKANGSPAALTSNPSPVGEVATV